MRKTFFIFNLVLGFVLSWTTAWGDFYVVAVGKRARRTVLVSPQSTAAASGTALLNALNGITDASETNPYLVIIEPGEYDIGGSTLQMKPYVDMLGSGENVTTIKGNVDSDSSGVLRGANNAELRFLTAENTGGGTYAVAIQNRNTPAAMTNVTAIAVGGTYNFAVFNAYTYFVRPKMTNVTARASGGMNNYGIYNLNSFPTMTTVTVTATGGTGDNHGVWSGDSSTSRIDHSVIYGSTNSVKTTATSTTFVGNTRLEGGAVSGPGTTTCAGVYDEDYTFYSSTCP